MLAVWELTEHDPSAFVSYDEIADEIERQSGERLSKAYIRLKISELQKRKLPYDTFSFERKRTHKLGNYARMFRLHDNTVTYLETAFVLVDLSRRADNHRIPTTALENTIEEAENYGILRETVLERIEEALRVGYIKKSKRIDICYDLSKRFHLEKEFLERLHTKYIQKHLALSRAEPSNSNPHTPVS